MKTRVGRKAWLEENRHVLLSSSGSLMSFHGHITFFSLQGTFPSGLLHILLSPPGARHSPFCSIFLRRFLSLIAIETVCAYQRHGRDVLSGTQGWLEKADHEQTRGLKVLQRGFCGQVPISVAVLVQKGNGLQKSSAGEMSSWGAAQRLKELIPDALGCLSHGLTLFLLKMMHSIFSYSQ